MRSLPTLKAAIAGAAASLLAGCLVSDEPVLDGRTGKAAPLKDGIYAACEDDERGDECDVFQATRREDGAYLFDLEDEPTAVLRFRRIARKAYAVQSAEGDGYAYYYGQGDSDSFALTLMLCDALPEKLRTRLIDKGDLSSEEENFEVCTVETLKGLAAAAKAYHRGQTTGDKDVTLVFHQLHQAISEE